MSLEWCNDGWCRVHRDVTLKLPLSLFPNALNIRLAMVNSPMPCILDLASPVLPCLSAVMKIAAKKHPLISPLSSSILIFSDIILFSESE